MSLILLVIWFLLALAAVYYTDPYRVITIVSIILIAVIVYLTLPWYLLLIYVALYIKATYYPTKGVTA